MKAKGLRVCSCVLHKSQHIAQLSFSTMGRGGGGGEYTGCNPLDYTYILSSPCGCMYVLIRYTHTMYVCTYVVGPSAIDSMHRTYARTYMCVGFAAQLSVLLTSTPLPSGCCFKEDQQPCCSRRGANLLHYAPQEGD